MSRLAKLIEELAPRGVRYAPLRTAVGYSDSRVNADELDETSFIGVDNLVADRGGRVNASFLPNSARLTAFEPGDVLLGNIRPYLKKVWRATVAGGCSGDVLALRIKPDARSSLSSEFLYYLLSSDDFFAYNTRNARGGKMPRGNKDAILNYRIPLPSSEIQVEIVSILDQFAQLEGALRAELDARRRQQTAVANNFAVSARDRADSDQAHERVKLGKIARESIEPVKVSPDETYVNLGVKWNGEGVIVRDARAGDSIKATTLYRAHAGQLIYNRMFVVEGSIALVPDDSEGAVVSAEFPLFDLDTSQVEPEWLLQHLGDPYTLKRIEGEVTGTERGSMKSRRRWKADQFANFEIDLPSLATQQEIVRVRRASSSLIASLDEELSARRRQHEYYRARLLTFKELAE